jgi:hypothetical protein
MGKYGASPRARALTGTCRIGAMLLIAAPRGEGSAVPAAVPTGVIATACIGVALRLARIVPMVASLVMRIVTTRTPLRRDDAGRQSEDAGDPDAASRTLEGIHRLSPGVGEADELMQGRIADPLCKRKAASTIKKTATNSWERYTCGRLRSVRFHTQRGCAPPGISRNVTRGRGYSHQRAWPRGRCRTRR